MIVPLYALLGAAGLTSALPGLVKQAVTALNQPAFAEAQQRDGSATRAFSSIQIKTSSGMCLFVDELSGDFRANLTPIQVAACNSSPGQRWDIITKGKHNNVPGKMLVVSSLTQACLNFDPRRAVGNQVLLFSCGGRADGQGHVTNSQLFTFSGGPGPLVLSPDNKPESCLVVKGDTIDISTCIKADVNQSFTFGSSIIARNIEETAQIESATSDEEEDCESSKVQNPSHATSKPAIIGSKALTSSEDKYSVPSGTHTLVSSNKALPPPTKYPLPFPIPLPPVTKPSLPPIIIPPMPSGVSPPIISESKLPASIGYETPSPSKSKSRAPLGSKPPAPSKSKSSVGSKLPTPPKYPVPTESKHPTSSESKSPSMTTMGIKHPAPPESKVPDSTDCETPSSSKHKPSAPPKSKSRAPSGSKPPAPSKSKSPAGSKLPTPPKYPVPTESKHPTSSESKSPSMKTMGIKYPAPPESKSPDSTEYETPSSSKHKPSAPPKSKSRAPSGSKPPATSTEGNKYAIPSGNILSGNQGIDKAVVSVSRAGGVLNPSAAAEANRRDDTATRAFTSVSIKSANGKCLFIDPTAGDFRENLIPVVFKACDGSPNEKFDFITAGKHNNVANSTLVVSSLTQGCLNFDPRRAAGDTVIIFSCGGRADGEGQVTDSQLFVFHEGETSLRLIPEGGKGAVCLVPNASGRLDQAACSTDAGQLFTII